MNAKDAIKANIEMCHTVITSWIGDFSDADIMVRPVPEANHSAWQLGHLISSEHNMVGSMGHDMPEMPDGFAESHSKESSTSDDASKFLKKDEYVALMGKMNTATLAALEATPEADLDKPSPEALREIVPTIGAAFNLIGVHLLMHGGQVVVLRRKLGKPVLF